MGKFKEVFAEKCKEATEEIRYRKSFEQKISDAMEEINQMQLGSDFECDAVLERSSDALRIKVSLSHSRLKTQDFWLRIDEETNAQGHKRYSFNFNNEDYPVFEEALNALIAHLAFCFVENGGTYATYLP